MGCLQSFLLLIFPPAIPQPPSTDPKINTLLSTIQSERRNLEGAKAVMRAVEASSRNEAVIQQAQNEVRSAQASIKFLEDELAKLQLVQGSTRSPMRGEAIGGSGRGQIPGQGMMTPSRSAGSAGTAVGSPSPSRVGISSNGGMDRPLPPPPMGQSQGEMRKEQKNYTQLGKLAERDTL